MQLSRKRRHIPEQGTIFRNGVPVPVPARYKTLGPHRRLVKALAGNSFPIAIRILEQHTTDSFLAADVYAGAEWAVRFLNTTARFWVEPPGTTGKRLGDRAVRALMHLLMGTSPRRVGRKPAGPLAPSETARVAMSLAYWQPMIDDVWLTGLWRTIALIEQTTRFTVSASHERVLAKWTRRRQLRKSEVVRTLVSWETGVPARRVFQPAQIADLVYM